ncbi:DUF947-domain-containing protein [Hypoxylon crocopeplum]|nr:DUF947-domain-containing protein [Hypoxylon crocopeplum]
MDRRTANKRKAPFPSLQRRVKARREEPEEIFSDESGENSSGDENSEGQSEEVEEQSIDESGSSSEDDEEAEDPPATVSRISFGALAKAQASLPNTRRAKGRKSQEDEEQEGEDDDDGRNYKGALESKAKAPKPHRLNKHAPTEQSSKRQVSRKREVVQVHKPVARDPRFSAAVSGKPLDEDKARRAYAFLDEYRDSEMARLRDTVKKTKDASAKEELKRALASMESRKKAQLHRDKERKVVAEHRRQEKDLVRQGKQPFYLKKSEQKKRLLLDRFADMKGKQVDRAIERRRKKLTARERRDMPVARREAR